MHLFYLNFSKLHPCLEFFSQIHKRFVYHCIKEKSLNKHTTCFYRAPKEVDLTQLKLDHPRISCLILHKRKQPISTQLCVLGPALHLYGCLDGAFPMAGKSLSNASALDTVRLSSNSLSKVFNSKADGTDGPLVYPICCMISISPRLKAGTRKRP